MEPPAKPKLLEQVSRAARLRHLSIRTEEAYRNWIRRFVRFHGTRHPKTLGPEEVRAFLSSLATEGKVAASTQNQALAALLFLYRYVLEQPLPQISDVVRARRPKRLPIVWTREEARRVLSRLRGTHALVGGLLYGSGLRLLECLRLRVKDVDFSGSSIIDPPRTAGTLRVLAAGLALAVAGMSSRSSVV
jgi:integrase